MNFQENVLVIEKDIIENLDFDQIKQRIDIIFMDPPYKEKNLSKLLIKIKKAKILSQEGIVIIHRHKKENDTFPKNFKIFEEKIYGISKVIFGYF